MGKKTFLSMFMYLTFSVMEKKIKELINIIWAKA